MNACAIAWAELIGIYGPRQMPESMISEAYASFVSYPQVFLCCGSCSGIKVLRSNSIAAMNMLHALVTVNAFYECIVFFVFIGALAFMNFRYIPVVAIESSSLYVNTLIGLSVLMSWYSDERFCYI